MPREFQDFSQEVSQGTDKIKGSLDAVRSAADQADVSSSRLSSTQDAGTRVADGYSRTMAGVSKELAGVASMGQNVARGLSGADSAIKTLGSSLSGIRGVTEELQGMKSAADDVASIKMDYLNKQIAMIDEESGRAAASMQKMRLTAGDLKDIRIGLTVDSLADDIKQAQTELLKLDAASGTLDKFQKQSFLNLSVKLAGAQEFQEFFNELPKAQKAALSLTRANYGLDAAIEQLAGSNEIFAGKLRKVQSAALDTAKAEKTYTGEVEKATNVTQLLNNKFQEGKKEAEGFAGGLGTTNGRLIGAGVAMLFVAKKAGELIDQFKDAALEVAEFEVQLAVLERRAQTLGLEGSFGDLRNELNLTRKQSEDFFKVFRSGVTSGVIEADKLSDAAAKLQNAFGGDPTKRLEEYVELLKEIPTLETDLQINANIDDQAASIFALAESGKIETVMELQAAGLLGGVTGEVSPEDAELLNAQQKTEKVMEDIRDGLLKKFFPQVGPQLSAIVGGTAKVAMAIGGVVAGLGVLSALGGAQVTAQNVTTAAILKGQATKDIGGAIKMLNKDAPTGSLMKKLFGGLGNIFKKKAASSVASSVGGNTAKQLATQGLRGFGPALGKAVGGGLLSTGTTAAAAGTTAAGGAASAGGGIAATAGAIVASPVVIAAAVAALAAGVGYAGMKLNEWGDDLEDEGRLVAAGFARVGGSALVAAASLTLLGPIAGPIAALGLAGESLGKGLENLGDGLLVTVNGVERFGPITRGFGSALKKTGEIVGGAGKFIKNGFKAAWNGLKAFGGMLKEGATRMFESDEFKQMTDEMKVPAQQLNAAIDELKESSKAYDDAISKSQKERLKSGFALQKNLKGLDAAVNSAKIKMMDLVAEIAKLEFESISEFGGSAGQFTRAINTATQAVKKRFMELNEATAARRVQVLDDIRQGKMNGEDARNAFLRIKQEEVKAAKTFIEGMYSAAKALFQAPRIIEEGLRREVAGIKLDMTLEEGIGGFDFLSEKITEGLEASLEEQEAVIAASKKAAKKAEESRKKIQEVTAQTVEIFKENMDRLPKEAQDALKGIKFEDGIAETKSLDKALDTLADQAEKASNALQDAADKLPTESFTKAAADFAAISEKVKSAGSVSRKARKNLTELEADGDADPAKLEAARKDVTDAAKREQEFVTKQAQMSDALANRIKKSLEPLEDAAKSEQVINNIIKAVGSGRAVTARELVGQAELSKNTRTALEQIVKEEQKLTEGSNGQLSALQQYENARKKLTEIVSAQGTLQALEVGVQDNISAWKNYKFSLEEIKRSIDSQKQIIAAIGALGRQGVAELERNLEIEKSRGALALLTNQTAESVNKIRENELKIAEKLVGNNKKAMMLAQKQRESLAQGLKDALQASGGEVTVDVTRFQTAIAEVDKQIQQLSEQGAKAAEIIGDIGGTIDRSLEEFEKSLTGRRLQQQLDLSGVQADLASFADDLEGAIAESTKTAIAVAQERARREEEILAKSTAKEIEMMERRAKAIEAMSGKGAADTFRQEQKALLLAKAQTKQGEIELKKKQAVVQAAQREASLKLEAIGLEEELIDSELDFLSEIGGSFDSILKLQQAGVALEMQKLNALQQQVEAARAAGTTGLELRKMEVALEKQKFALNKKQFGVQKDIFEKLIGKAFGEMRSDIGAARRRGSDVTLMGRQNTRVMGRSGLFMKTGPGGPGTLAQRAADRAISAAFGSVGGGKLGRGLNEKEPKRLKIEEDIAANTKEGADAGKKLTDAATKKGSIYTHDTTSEGYLKQIALYTGMLANGMQATTGENDLEGPLMELKKKVEDQMAKEKNGVALASSDSKETKQSIDNLAEEVKKTGSDQQEQTKSTSEQLKVARSSFAEQISLARTLSMDKSNEKEAQEAFAKAGQELDKIQNLEKALRRKEIMNPLAQGATSTDMQRILSGKPSKEQQAYMAVQNEMTKRATKATETTATQAKKTGGAKMAPQIVDWEKERFKIARERGAQMQREFQLKKAGITTPEQYAQMVESGKTPGQIEKEKKDAEMYGIISQYGSEKMKRQAAFDYGDEEALAKFGAADEKKRKEEEVLKAQKDFVSQWQSTAASDEDSEGITDWKRDERERMTGDINKMANMFGMSVSEGMVDAFMGGGGATADTPAEEVVNKSAEGNEPAVAAVTDRQNKEEAMRNSRATQEDISGMNIGPASEFGGTSVMGPQAGGTESLQIGGQIQINLDTNMFRAEVKQLMAESITSPEVRSQLDKLYLNPNSAT